MINIHSLHIYPVKSLQGIDLQTSRITPSGLQYDREWMIVDSNNTYITQRQYPEMAKISTALNDKLILSNENINDLEINLQPRDKELINVIIWRDKCKAFDEGDHAAEWLNEIFRSRGKFRLVRIANTLSRKVSSRYLNGFSSFTTFTDGYPFLFTSVESLDLLNKRLTGKGKENITMDRFRPSVVINGVRPFEEDKIKTLTGVGNKFQFKLVKPCIRCKIPSVDQKSGEIKNPGEPLKSLFEIRVQPKIDGAYFGQNGILIGESKGTIRCGDQLQFNY